MVSYDPALRNAALELSSTFPEIRNELESLLGWKIDFVPDLVLIRRHAEFVDVTGSGIFTAFAVPSRSLIVIDYSKMKTPLDLRSTTKHELCHLLLHARIRTVAIPRWLDEGVAQWSSGGASEILYPGEKDVLKQAVLAGHLIPLRDLSHSFPHDPRGTFLAYEESKSFVEFIDERYGSRRLLLFLDALRQESSIEEAAEKTFGSAPSEIERLWKQKLLNKFTWPMYLSDHFYWILFAVAGVITLLGYLRLRRRMKEYRDEGVEEAEDDNG